MAELSQRDLDRRVADLLGKRVISGRGSYLNEAYSCDLEGVFRDVVPFAEARGFWLKYTGSFQGPDGPVFAGFTPHNTSGWNGRPDYEASADTPATAICRAFVALAEGEKWDG